MTPHHDRDVDAERRTVNVDPEKPELVFVSRYRSGDAEGVLTIAQIDRDPIRTETMPTR